MIQGMFGDLELASVSISELRNQHLSAMNQPVRQQQRQSQIFSQHTFHIEIQRPNFDSIELNHPLLSMDLTDILKSQFFHINSSKLKEMLKINQQYLNEYQNKQDSQIAMENRVDHRQIAQMNVPIKNNNNNMINHNENQRRNNKFDEEQIKAQIQEQNNSVYPFINSQQNQEQSNYRKQNSNISEQSLNDILNYFKQSKEQQVDLNTIKYYVEIFKTTDPKQLLEEHKKNYR